MGTQADPRSPRDAGPMRILHLVSTGERRGAEIFASDLIASMRTHGIRQRVVVVEGTGPLNVRFDAPTNALRGTIQVPFIRVAPRAVGDLRRLLRDFDPDVVQAHGGSTLKYAAMATLGIRSPFVFRSIGLAPPWIRRGPRRITYRSLMRRSARIVAVADVVRRELIEVFDVPEARVTTIPNAVDATRLEPRRSREATRQTLGIPPDERVILSMGALTWEKDPMTHLMVSSRIMESRPSVTHLFLGDGPMQGDLKSAIRQRGLDGRVRMLGSRDDVGDVLCAVDIVLFASRSDGMEGMPGIAIEAGMMGRPVAGYGVAGTREVVLDGQTGLLASPGDVDGLTDSVLRLIDDEGERQALGTAAMHRCRSRYDISAIANRYLELYAELVA